MQAGICIEELELVMEDIKGARIRAGLSQAEVAKKLGVVQATMSNWEIKRTQPNAEQRRKLKILLGSSRDQGDLADASPLAAWLSKARMEKRWSVAELAHKAGLTPAAIYRIESGVTRNLREVTRKNLEKAQRTSVPDDTAKEVAEEAAVEGLGTLEDFDPHSDAERPTGGGIYVLYDISERPIYVGEGGNVRKRIKDHEEKFWFKRPIVETASWISIDDSGLRRQVETLLIKFLKSNAVINKQNVERG